MEYLNLENIFLLGEYINLENIYILKPGEYIFTRDEFLIPCWFYKYCI